MKKFGAKGWGVVAILATLVGGVAGLCYDLAPKDEQTQAIPASNAEVKPEEPKEEPKEENAQA